MVLTAVEMQPPGSKPDFTQYPLIEHGTKPETAPEETVPEETTPEDPPPAPSCSQYTDYNSCVSNSACSWDRVKSVCHDN